MLAVIDYFPCTGMFIRRSAAAYKGTPLENGYLEPGFSQSARCGETGDASADDANSRTILIVCDNAHLLTWNGLSMEPAALGRVLPHLLTSGFCENHENFRITNPTDTPPRAAGATFELIDSDSVENRFQHTAPKNRQFLRSIKPHASTQYVVVTLRHLLQ